MARLPSGSVIVVTVRLRDEARRLIGRRAAVGKSIIVSDGNSSLTVRRGQSPAESTKRRSCVRRDRDADHLMADGHGLFVDLQVGSGHHEHDDPMGRVVDQRHALGQAVRRRARVDGFVPVRRPAAAGAQRSDAGADAAEGEREPERGKVHRSGPTTIPAFSSKPVMVIAVKSPPPSAGPPSDEVDEGDASLGVVLRGVTSARACGDSDRDGWAGQRVLPHVERWHQRHVETVGGGGVVADRDDRAVVRHGHGRRRGGERLDHRGQVLRDGHDAERALRRRAGWRSGAARSRTGRRCWGTPPAPARAAGGCGAARGGRGRAP